MMNIASLVALVVIAGIAIWGSRLVIKAGHRSPVDEGWILVWLGRIVQALVFLAALVMIAQYANIKLPLFNDSSNYSQPVEPSDIKPEEIQPRAKVVPSEELDTAKKDLDNELKDFRKGL